MKSSNDNASIKLQADLLAEARKTLAMCRKEPTASCSLIEGGPCPLLTSIINTHKK